MKIPSRLLVASLSILAMSTLSSCALLSSVVGLLSAPLNLVNGLLGDASSAESMPDGTLRDRGRQVESLGLYEPLRSQPPQTEGEVAAR